MIWYITFYKERHIRAIGREVTWYKIVFLLFIPIFIRIETV